jgi:PIN domain nuclease of toxin-antitoxin system
MTLGTRGAPLTHEIAVASSLLELHDDPADRLIAATSQVLNLTLVTADERLLGLGVIRTLGNR